MTYQHQAAARGNPPNRDQLAEFLKDRLPLWNEVRETVKEIGADWKWAYSEATGSWSYRSYLPGDRFFASLMLADDGFEVSLNLKSDEWQAIVASSREEQARLDLLRSKMRGSENEPAWIHLPVTDSSALPLLATILVTRARRIQKPRLKASKKK